MDDREGIHMHCYACFNRKCSDNFSTVCPIVECEENCGALYHKCKQREHEELCKNQKVPCINAGAGCPAILPRWIRGAHLETCPASVIRCSCQWNRWPMYSVALQSKARLPLNNPYVKCAQLDVALALRDQRMLLAASEVPRKVKRILRNPITPIYPAVPFEKTFGDIDENQCMVTSAESVRTNESDDDFAPWKNYRFPPGLGRSICHKLLGGFEDGKHEYNSTATESTANIRYKEKTITCMLCSNKNKTGFGGLVGLSKIKDIGEENSVLHDADLTEYVKFAKGDESKDKKDKIVSASSDYSCSIYNDWNYDKSFCDECSLPQSAGDEEFLSNILDDADPISGARKLLESSVPLKLNQILGVDLNIESISAYQSKPASMYTFLCGQDFRRDEYGWHFHNVHNEIQASLNNWMEQRCPLACYGCTFTFHRLQPTFGESSSFITHSVLLESFGLQTITGCLDESSDVCLEDTREGKNRHALREATPEILTSHKFDSVVTIKPRYDGQFIGECSELDAINIVNGLPFMIWCKILSHLDSFSFNNLSLVCKQLRDICSTHLESHGMVVSTWRKVNAADTNHCCWEVNEKKWKFSTAFTPIKRWKFAPLHTISEHLKVCKYNQDKTTHSKPVKLIAMHAPDG